MTLDTRIAIRTTAPTSAREVFQYCRALLNTPADVPVEERVGEGHRQGQRELANPCGIGLDAWLIVYYGADGPMHHVCTEWCETEVGPAKWDKTGKVQHTAEDVAEHREYIAEKPTTNGWATIEISIDTSYGFMNDRGESCSDRHARFIAELGEWLDQRGCAWKWQNEYTCEWFDRYDGLEDFGNFHTSDGGPAQWFADMVMPAVRHMIGEEAN